MVDSLFLFLLYQNGERGTRNSFLYQDLPYRACARRDKLFYTILRLAWHAPFFVVWLDVGSDTSWTIFKWSTGRQNGTCRGTGGRGDQNRTTYNGNSDFCVLYHQGNVWTASKVKRRHNGCSNVYFRTYGHNNFSTTRRGRGRLFKGFNKHFHLWGGTTQCDSTTGHWF